jgi:hypothetical protein
LSENNDSSGLIEKCVILKGKLKDENLMIISDETVK